MCISTSIHLTCILKRFPLCLPLKTAAKLKQAERTCRQGQLKFSEGSYISYQIIIYLLWGMPFSHLSATLPLNRWGKTVDASYQYDTLGERRLKPTWCWELSKSLISLHCSYKVCVLDFSASQIIPPHSPSPPFCNQEHLLPAWLLSCHFPQVRFPPHCPLRLNASHSLPIHQGRRSFHSQFMCSPPSLPKLLFLKKSVSSCPNKLHHHSHHLSTALPANPQKLCRGVKWAKKCLFTYKARQRGTVRT